MKRSIAILAAAAAANIFWLGQAHAQILPFTGTRENVNPLLPPGSGRCAPAFFNTVTITPGELSSTGTSNILPFTSTQSPTDKADRHGSSARRSSPISREQEPSVCLGSPESRQFASPTIGRGE